MSDRDNECREHRADEPQTDAKVVLSMDTIHRLSILVEIAGLEPAASGLQSRRSPS